MIFFEKKFLVVWKYAQMHQNTFLTTPVFQKYLCWKKSFWWSGSMLKCIKTRFKPLQTVKNIFFEQKFLGVWKYAQMHQNTFLITTDVPKYLFWKKVSGGLEVCANASKHVFNLSRRSKISFLKKSIWWLKRTWWYCYESMRKSINTGFYPLQMLKNIYDMIFF